MRKSSPFWLFALVAACSLLGSGCNSSGANKTPAPPSPPQSIKSEPAPQSAGGSLFADVTQAAGISYRWTIAGARPLTILQTIGNGGAFLDYDSDGALDILLVGPKLALYKGDGKGHFTDTTAQTGLDKLTRFLGCAVGDYDNDGFADVYLTAYRGGALLHNEGGRRFQNVSQTAGVKPVPWGTSATFADVDNDGKLDLYICNYVKFGIHTQPQLCDYGKHKGACGPRFYEPEIGVLYHNEGSGKFRDITKAWGAHKVTGKGLGVAAADFDGSGRVSFAIGNDEVPGDLLHNLKGKFENIGATSGTAYDNDGNVHGGMGVDWGDYDNDGKLDLFVATFQHEAKNVYHNEGAAFTDHSSQLGLVDSTRPFVAFGTKWFDYDNDGWLDLILANGHVQDNINDVDKSATFRQKTQLFRNVNGTAFEDMSASAGPSFQKEIMGRGLAIGDYDNDGRVDALVIDSDGEPLLLHNETPQAGHWLSLTLEGVKSNRDGIGAIIIVEVGGKKITRRCATDGSYMSASDRRVPIGLGTATAAETITVRWPSGKKDVYRNVTGDRFVTLREGDPSVRTFLASVTEPSAAPIRPTQ